MTPVWIAATVVELAGIALVALDYTIVHTWLGFGTVTAEALFGDVLIGGGAALGMIGGGIRNPWALTVVPMVIILLLFAATYGWFGPGVRL